MNEDKKFIDYRILEDPFTEVGPILIGNPAFSSVGLKVQFLPENGSSWVANLPKSNWPINELYYLESPNVLVIAGGNVYLIDTASRKIKTDFHSCEDIVQIPDGTVIVAHPTHLTVVAPDCSYWQSSRLSYDGIKDLEVKGNVVHGLCWDPTDKSVPWKPFTLNVKTREIQGGGYRPI